MRGFVATCAPFARQAEGAVTRLSKRWQRESAPSLGPTPQVNLVVFGFDAVRRADPNWRTQCSTLKSALATGQARLRTAGNPGGAKL
jgi:hypothetical protein